MPTGIVKRVSAVVRAGDGGVSDDALRRINRHALRAMKADEVVVRTMDVVNDQRDAYHTRFTKRALDDMRKLFATGRAISEGHRWDVAPLARSFYAERMQDAQGVEWVRTHIYWPALTQRGQDMTAMVDSGVWSEVSAAFWLSDFKCSICNGEMGSCEHVPGDEYDGRSCEGIMGGVEDVLEASFVLKGAQVGTSIGLPEGERERDVDTLMLRALNRRGVIEPAASPWDAWWNERRRPQEG